MSKIAYLAEGRKVEIVGPVKGGTLVRLGHTGYYGDEVEEWFDGLHIAEKLFDKPPTALYDKTIVELEAKRVELESEVGKLRRELHELPRQKEALVKELQKYDALELVDDFVSGRITHLVEKSEWSASVSILKLDDLKDKDWPHDLKLLVLFGTTKRDLQWKLSYYSDGSGGQGKRVYPCTSEQAAVTKAKSLLTEVFEKLNANFSSGQFEQAASSASLIGMEIPPHLADRNKQVRKGFLEAAIEKAETELAAKRAQLGAIQ